MELKFGLSKVLSFTRRVLNGDNSTDVKTDPAGGSNLTATHLGAPGDDSHPLPGDLAALLPIAGEGNQAAAGYIDVKNAGQAQEGERRLYSRNSAGEVVAVTWLKNDGQVLIMNDSGFFLLEAGGTVNINGAKIPPSGDVITASGISLDGHTHLYQDTGAVVNPATTQPPQ